ncbi:MAG: GNAT family N-acetyltransferase [Gammaproteobacteria bacterium]|nr:GNAT family N-acetyltransferase [Gammaproteobacteria bacterium]MCP5135740.1 GNAT family N-acetyltransferase [Gammaproteobacteria bacterium]
MSAALNAPFPDPSGWHALLAQWEIPSRITPEERITLMNALRVQLDREPEVLHAPESRDLRDRIQALTLAIDDLTLAIVIGQARIARDEASVDEAIDVAIALWRHGHGADAFALCRRLLLMHRKAERALHVLDDILAWERKIWPLPLPDATWSDGTLSLEPLGHQHLNDFAWAYADPDIAERCCLPRFDNNDQWHGWLDRISGYNDQMTFGVWHADWGFIGSVSLVMADDIGFFYYWIASDFQSLGLGPRAAALLFDLAEQAWGMRCCYAKVFTDNIPSIRALTKLGFTNTNIAIRSDDRDEWLYRWSPESDFPAPPALRAEAHLLFERMGSTTRVLSLLAPTEAIHRPRLAHAKVERPAKQDPDATTANDNLTPTYLEVFNQAVCNQRPIHSDTGDQPNQKFCPIGVSCGR